VCHDLTSGFLLILLNASSCEIGFPNISGENSIIAMQESDAQMNFTVPSLASLGINLLPQNGQKPLDFVTMFSSCLVNVLILFRCR